jgi:hypothetical protein
VEIPGRLKQKAKIEKLPMLQENKKASKGYKTPSEALTLAFSGNPFSLLYPRKVRVKSS